MSLRFALALLGVCLFQPQCRSMTAPECLVGDSHSNCEASENAIAGPNIPFPIVDLLDGPSPAVAFGSDSVLLWELPTTQTPLASLEFAPSSEPQADAVPEPAPSLLLGIGLLAILIARIVIAKLANPRIVLPKTRLLGSTSQSPANS